MKLEQLIRNAVLAMEEHGDIDVVVFDRPGHPLLSVKNTLPVDDQQITDGHNTFRRGPAFVLLP